VDALVGGQAKRRADNRVRRQREELRSHHLGHAARRVHHVFLPFSIFSTREPGRLSIPHVLWTGRSRLSVHPQASSNPVPRPAMEFPWVTSVRSDVRNPSVTFPCHPRQGNGTPLPER